MKEYTITYTAEITEIWKPNEHECEFEETIFCGEPEEIADYVKDVLKADDVHVSKVKVFEHEL